MSENYLGPGQTDSLHSQNSNSSVNSLRTKQPNLKMRLLVAISVLVLVLAAHSDAQESEPTLEQRFTQFQQQMQTLTDDLAEKTKTALEQFHTSEFAVKTKGFFAEQFEKLKQKMEETFPSQS